MPFSEDHDDALEGFLMERLAGVGPHDRWMRLALEEARAAAEADEVPVGAVVVAGGRVIAAAHNQRRGRAVQHFCGGHRQHRGDV